MKDILERAVPVKLVIFDVDGVLTDGGIIIDNNGHEHKIFHSRDGHGMKMLQHTGVEIAIITGRTTDAVTHRMKSLGIEHVYQGQQDKLPAYKELLQKLSLVDEQVAYVGDDVVDLPVMSRVGLSIAVQDAHIMVKKHAHWQTPNRGGFGAARDVCELIMEGQGNLESMLSRYLAV
ncbi:MAG: 3-deoxy-manno-octulosonate-8-phosphatase KdsC [Gammaproteobacteria bacterium]